MKRYALHVPLSERQRKALLKAAKDAGVTQGEYARKLMYGKLDPLAAVKRADLSEGSTWIKVKTPEMKYPLTLKSDGKVRK